MTACFSFIMCVTLVLGTSVVPSAHAHVDVPSAGVPYYIVPPRHVTFDSLSNPTLVPRSIGYPPLPNATWTITASCCGYGPFSEDAVANASRHHGGLFDFPCGWPTMPFVGEWGYEFHHNQNNIFPICGNLTAAGYSSPPANRDDALARLHRYWECRVASARASVNKTVSDPAFSMIGHYFYAGLSAAFGDGPVIPGTEIGENINSINAHLAFSRGAARQFGHAFIVDFSAWMGGFIRDFSTSRFWGPASSPVGGHSTSLFRRAYFASFMAGGGALIAEAGAVNYFFEDELTPSGVFRLSPVGEIGADLFQTSHRGGDPEAVRGVPYVPMALVTEQPLGMGLGWWYEGLAWDVFPLSNEEQRTTEWFAELWPQSFHVQNDENNNVSSESFYMVGGPMGDAVDVLLPHNLSEKTLAEGYRVVVVAGGGSSITSSSDPSFASTIEAYVASGGSVVLYADAIVSSTFSSNFVGFEIGPAAVDRSVTSVEDLQTGWTNTAVEPFCVEATSTSFYIKTGGDPTKRSGWDGGVDDKCCSVDHADCYWFPSMATCQLTLLEKMKMNQTEKGRIGGVSLALLCRSCVGSFADVGCPGWPASGKMEVYNVTSLSTARPLLQLTTDSQEEAEEEKGTAAVVPGAMINSYGNGTLVVVLISNENSPASGGGFGIARHLIERIKDDTSVVSIADCSNQLSSSPMLLTSNKDNCRLQLLVNKSPAGWNITLINNNGVVKQTNASEVIDVSEGRVLRLVLGGGYEARRAWISRGRRDEAPVELEMVNASMTVPFAVPAGEVRLVGFATASP